MSTYEVPPETAIALQDLTTHGWTVLRTSLSERLLRKVMSEGTNRPNYRYIRQTYDGLPHRIIERLLGPVVFSGRYKALGHWHMGRPDIHSSGPPAAFIPGIDLIAPLPDTPLELELIPASGRLLPREHPLLATARRVVVAPLDVVLIDTRVLRRNNTPGVDTIAFTVVREWITPAEVWLEGLGPDVPDRASAFFGRNRLPSRDVKSWLSRTHGVGV